MEEAPPSLHVFDLDGTLLRSDTTLGERSRTILNQLIEAGVALTVASARSIPAMHTLLSGLNLTLPVIELNGAFISDFNTGQHLSYRLLPTESAAIAIDTLLALGLDPVVTTWDGRNDHVSYGPRLNSGNRWFVAEKAAYGDPRLRAVPSVAAVALAEGVATVTTFTPTLFADMVTADLRIGLDGTASIATAQHPHVAGWSEVQVANVAVEKGEAVRRFRLEFAPNTRRLVVYGDHLNDLSMFTVADCSVAPSNAHPEVLRHANVIVGSNDVDSIAEHALMLCQGAAPTT